MKYYLKTIKCTKFHNYNEFINKSLCQKYIIVSMRPNDGLQVR